MARAASYYNVMTPPPPTQTALDPEALRQWREQCRRQLQRPIQERMLFGFCRTPKPVLDAAPYRIFDSMQAYREWCETHLPKWLGYAKQNSKV